MATFRDAVATAFKAVITGSAPILAGDTGGRPSTSVGLFDPVIARSIVEHLSAGDLYATQPHLRTVVSFVARNGAQLGRHVYTNSTDGRTRVRTSPAATLLNKPNAYQTGYDLFNMLFSELALHDFALWIPSMVDGNWEINPIPANWITGVEAKSAFRQERYKIQPAGSTSWYWVSASDVVVFRGYSPNGFKSGSSAVHSLKSTLSEQVSAMQFREQMWARGGRVGMFMTRPKDAPTWSPEAQAKFVQNWRNSWSGSGANAGATPLLEDGMELKRVGFTAKDEQWLEAATLSLSTVAGAYHVPPAMVGVPGYNSFASVKEFRKMLYTETLGPSIAQVEDTINTFLLPLIGEPANHYLELNIGEKMQGDFEEQSAVLQQAVGGPYMTVNEARERNNLPKIDGGDELLAPLNMGAAGNNGPLADEPINTDPSEASEEDDPATTPPKSHSVTHGDRVERGHAFVKADTKSDALTDDLAAFFKRQKRLVTASIGGKAANPEWWNQKKWNQELSSLLLPHAITMSAGAARDAGAKAGVDTDDYSVARTENFLKSVSNSRADLINSTTRDRVKQGLDDDLDPDEAFDFAIGDRSHESAATMKTFFSAWGALEMGRQLLSDKGPTKTWVSSGLPNSRHADMDGETVKLDEKFSNGADMPGDPALGAEQVANCGCGVDIQWGQ